MTKVKILLTLIVACSVAGGVLAFKTSNKRLLRFCTTATVNNRCDNPIRRCGTFAYMSLTGTSAVCYTTIETTFCPGIECPVRTYTTPQF